MFFTFNKGNFEKEIKEIGLTNRFCIIIFIGKILNLFSQASGFKVSIVV